MSAVPGTKFTKAQGFLITIAAIFALVATLQGVLNFPNERNTVALAAVQKLSEEPVHLLTQDENNTVFVTNGETVWKVKMTQVDGKWVPNVSQQESNVTANK